MNDFIITNFENVLYIEDTKGKKINFENRRCASFIITVKGKITFTYDGGYILSDEKHAVFLPEGLSYTNKCIENAESYVFNFHTQKKYETPIQLNSLHSKTAEEIYKKINTLCSNNSLKNNMLIFSEIYNVAAQLFENNNQNSNGDRLISKAIQFMHENYSDSTLVVSDISDHLFISEIYLRKLFSKKYDTTPFKYLTKIRMEQAKFLAAEKIPVGEIALQVGYSDVYQFSRAYKRFYGHSPTDI